MSTHPAATLTEYNMLNFSTTEVVVIGIGDNVNQTELEILSGDPINNLFRPMNFTDLMPLKDRIVQFACRCTFNTRFRVAFCNGIL